MIIKTCEAILVSLIIGIGFFKFFESAWEIFKKWKSNSKSIYNHSPPPYKNLAHKLSYYYGFIKKIIVILSD